MKSSGHYLRRILRLLACGGFVLAASACGDQNAGPARGGDSIKRSAALDSLQVEAERLYAEGDIEQAQQLLEAVVERSRAAGDSASTARGLTWLSQAAWRLGDYEGTREKGEEALAIKLASRNPEDLFRSYNVLGLLAWNESRPFDAVELFAQASAAAEAAFDTANLAKVWNNLGLVQLSLGQYADAREGFGAARHAAASLGEQLIEGRVLINLGNLDLEVGNLRSSIRYLESSQPLLEAAGDVIGEQILLGHLGTAYRALGDPGQAMDYLEVALQRAQDNGLRQEEAINLEQMAELHRAAGDDRQALRLFAEARSINEELGLVDEQASDLRSESEIHANLGDIPLALQKTRQALITHEEIGYPLEQMHDLIALSALAATAGWEDSALAFLELAGELSSDLDARSARISFGLGSARVAKELEQPAAALRALTAIQSDLQLGAYSRQWEAEALRAWAHGSTGELDSAVAAGLRAMSAVERVRVRYTSGPLRASHLNAREQVYTDQSAVLLRMGRVREAFETADRVRARSLLEHLSAGRDDVLPGTAAREFLAGEQLLRQISELADRADEIEALPPEWSNSETREQLDLLRTELTQSRTSYAEVVLRAGESDPRGAAMLGGTPIDTRSVAATLRPDEALLEYLVTPDDVLIFVLTRDTIRYFSSRIPRTTLASRIRVARAEAGAPGREPSPALARLYGDLVGPVRASGALGGVERLLIVPHAELTYLPFSALRNPDSDRYLVEDYVVTHLPSAGILPVLRSTAMRAQFAAVGFAPFPVELPGTLDELDALQRSVRDVALHRGPAATERQVRLDLATGRAVHVATHGILSTRNPMFSRIEFAPGTGDESDDGRLEVHELLGLPIRSPIVFLSGCETGVGAAWSTAFSRGEDYATLSRAFLYAGAEAVIATLWPVEDEGASRFAERFYLSIPSLDSGESLAWAQRAMIADEQYAAPYYWAGYRLTGRSELRLSAQ